MNNKNDSSSGGLGIVSVLGIVFIVLKLVGVIDWSWWWVLSPFWIGFAFTALIFILWFLYYKWDEKRRDKKMFERMKEQWNKEKNKQDKDWNNWYN